MPLVRSVKVVATSPYYALDLPTFIQFSKIRVAHVEYTNKQSNAVPPGDTRTGPYRALAIKMNTYNDSWLDAGNGQVVLALQHIFLIKAADTTTIYQNITSDVYDWQVPQTSTTPETVRILYLSFMLDAQPASIDITPSNPVVLTLDFFS